MAFGGRVVEDLAHGIGAHAATARESKPRKAEPYTFGVGCVPWLTSHGVVDALFDLDEVCIVVDKGATASDAVRRLATDGRGLWQLPFLGLEDVAPLDQGGNAPVVGPGRMPGDRVLEPVRAAGWAGAPGGRPRPLLHAKLLVVGVGWSWEGEYGELRHHLTPVRAWAGSANWTEKSAAHLEFGCWSDDAAFVQAALGFLIDVLRFSEPLGDRPTEPTPEMLRADWDDEAFAEYFAEWDTD